MPNGPLPTIWQAARRQIDLERQHKVEAAERAEQSRRDAERLKREMHTLRMSAACGSPWLPGFGGVA